MAKKKAKAKPAKAKKKAPAKPAPKPAKPPPKPKPAPKPPAAKNPEPAPLSVSAAARAIGLTEKQARQLAAGRVTRATTDAIQGYAERMIPSYAALAADRKAARVRDIKPENVPRLAIALAGSGSEPLDSVLDLLRIAPAVREPEAEAAPPPEAPSATRDPAALIAAGEQVAIAEVVVPVRIRTRVKLTEQRREARGQPHERVDVAAAEHVARGVARIEDVLRHGRRRKPRADLEIMKDADGSPLATDVVFRRIEK
jgi:hypothetical protein